MSKRVAREQSHRLLMLGWVSFSDFAALFASVGLRRAGLGPGWAREIVVLYRPVPYRPARRGTATMTHTDRASAQTNQGKGARIESLEGRLLLSGSFGGGEGDRFRPSVNTLVATGDFNGDGKADLASLITV